ncbi:FAD-dependent oxidoreductase [Stygiobacter electus]|uniref:FAD-dependent oxidoreductase n=1 Tax=Stygiobacter electus TaxID=3032292 RepID=A0AAE3P4G7_9BACT|nr:FAD-dependent oxidoreductase [Stygiobacter electus]MDF1613088.1 FAD-dependent oxidoreductase [Stygiobacter electus]
MAIIKKYQAKVEQIINPFQSIYTVTLSSDKKFQYLPGQFLHLALDEYDGAGQWPESRCFSMQSSPEEKNIKITFAVKGNFTTRMKNELYEGKEVWLKLPYGDLFQRNHDKKNCVFIAGGTGITPFLSLFNSEEFNEYSNPKIYLGFRSKEYNIYERELSTIRNNSCDSSIIYEDVDGVLNINTIFNECGIKSTYFISGPPIMIKNFKKYLIDNGVHENKVITDDWE